MVPLFPLATNSAKPLDANHPSRELSTPVEAGVAKYKAHCLSMACKCLLTSDLRKKLHDHEFALRLLTRYAVKHCIAE